jgi:hypothetical protein
MSLARGDVLHNTETDSDSLFHYLEDLHTQSMFLKLDSSTTVLAEQVSTLFEKLSITKPEITTQKSIETKYETKITIQKYDVEMSEPPSSVT